MKPIIYWFKLQKEKEEGLTLVELLAVIVILAIVATIAFVSVSNIIENSRKDAHIANALQIISAAKQYEANGGTIQEGIGHSSGIQVYGSDGLIEKGYLETLVSPWKDQTDYGTNAIVYHNGNEYLVDNFDGAGCKFPATGAPEGFLLEKDRNEICK